MEENKVHPQTNHLYFLNSGEHPIGEDARKHKLQLLIYSSIALICVFFRESKLSMVLGVKFDNSFETYPIVFVPFLFTLILYHLYMYQVTLNESSEIWKSQKKEYKNKPENSESYVLRELIRLQERKINKSCDLSIGQKHFNMSVNELDSYKEKLESEISELRNVLAHYKNHLPDDIPIQRQVGESTDDYKLRQYRCKVSNYICRTEQLVNQVSRYREGTISSIDRIKSNANKSADAINEQICLINETFKSISYRESWVNHTFPYIVFPYFFASFALCISAIFYLNLEKIIDSNYVVSFLLIMINVRVVYSLIKPEKYN